METTPAIHWFVFCRERCVRRWWEVMQQTRFSRLRRADEICKGKRRVGEVARGCGNECKSGPTRRSLRLRLQLTEWLASHS